MPRINHTAKNLAKVALIQQLTLILQYTGIYPQINHLGRLKPPLLGCILPDHFALAQCGLKKAISSGF